MPATSATTASAIRHGDDRSRAAPRHRGRDGSERHAGQQVVGDAAAAGGPREVGGVERRGHAARRRAVASARSPANTAAIASASHGRTSRAGGG